MKLKEIFGKKKVEISGSIPRQDLENLEGNRRAALIQFEVAMGLPLGTIKVNDPNLRINLTEEGFFKSVSFPMHLELTRRRNGRYVARWVMNDRIGNDSRSDGETEQDRD